MKNLYPKSKAKKIHPSPPPPPAGGGGGDAMGVLKLLPAAILVLTAALRDEDKEVLAYLVTRAMNGAAATSVAGNGQEKRPCGRKGAAAFDCGCFECYTRFWSRWDASPDRELIHQAIEAFEEHLARSEREAGRSRRRDKGKKGKDKAAAPPPPPPPVAAEEQKAVVVNEEAEAEVEVVVEAAAAAASGGAAGEQRRGWPDVMGIFNSRLWSLWSPAA